jgi:hypothetical protein
MAVELRTKIESEMGVELSMMKVFAGETISSLASTLALSLQTHATSTSASRESPKGSEPVRTAVPSVSSQFDEPVS